MLSRRSVLKTGAASAAVAAFAPPAFAADASPSATLIQYWRSFEQLEAYARAPERAHLPVWRWFNQKLGSNGDIGIWHETYLIEPGKFECIYGNMPPFGLGAASNLVKAEGRLAAAKERFAA